MRTGRLFRSWKDTPPISERLPDSYIRTSDHGTELFIRRGRDPDGPLLELKVVLTTGEKVDVSEMGDMLETIIEMIQETFAAQVVEARLEPVYRRPLLSERYRWHERPY